MKRFTPPPIPMVVASLAAAVGWRPRSDLSHAFGLATIAAAFSVAWPRLTRKTAGWWFDATGLLRPEPVPVNVSHTPHRRRRLSRTSS